MVRRLISEASRLAALLVGPLLVPVLIGCGGTSEQPRPEPPEIYTVPKSTDEGSGPYDCRVDDDFELVIFEDWENGAGSAWYTNNEYCQDVNDINTEYDELARVRDCLLGAKDGCTPEETLEEIGREEEDLEDVIQGYDALIDENREQLASAGSPQCDASQIPVFGSKPLPATRIADVDGEPRCGSIYALNLRTIRMQRDAGTIGLNFAEPFDARDFDGISFWARRSLGSPDLLALGIAEKHTDEKFLDEDGEPPCLFNTNSLERETLACDKFTEIVPLKPDWQFFTVAFDDMRQKGFGKPAPFLDRGAISGVSINYAAGAWELWIDDIGFYKRQ